jgi:outer membrane protein assembly factor BamB
MMLRFDRHLFAITMTLIGVSVSLAADPWSTYRGNPQRTGNTDNIAGPEAPKILWVYKSQDHFIAAPVPTGDEVVFSGLGGFNRPMFFALPMNPKGAVEPLWTRTAPYLKLPTVSSPAVVDGKLVFGDGMHQTDGAILHCLPATGGLPYWQLVIPGELVHLEGSPTVADKRVFIGGGSAGVLCVEMDKATIDGKEYDLPTIAKMQTERWKELQAKYEATKKTDEFAMPPNEDQLHKSTPKILWQQGKTKWHVDAPVNVIGDKVLVASAFLDKEKVGDRSIFCLNAKTGEQLWTKKLNINPWGGPTVADGIVVVTSSTIPYDTKLLKGAKGEVVAFDLMTGDVKWRKELPAGVLGCAAIASGQVVCTASDGKVRTYALKDGGKGIVYDAKAPIFAPPAVVGDTIYAADLKGVVHAIDLKSGAMKWTLDLAADPVKSPGMVYGGITVHGGKLFVATCNLEGANARQPTAIVCIGAK